MKNVIYIFICLCVFFLVSCDNAQDVTHDWGTQVYYSDFWFKKYVPDTLYKTLIVESDVEVSGNVQLQLYKKIEGNKEIPVETSEVQLYVEGERCLDNIIVISPGTTKLSVGMLFSEKAIDGKYKWYLKVKNRGDVEVLNGCDLTNATNVIFEWKAKRREILNPLASGLIWTGVGLIVLSLLWFLISRCIIWSSTKFSVLYIDYCDGQGQKRINMAGAYELVCTNDINKKDSFLQKLIKGKRQFEYNDFWIEPITIRSGKIHNSISITRSRNYHVSGDLRRREEIEIIDMEGNSVKIETT